jgi:hypothetical protein
MSQERVCTGAAGQVLISCDEKSLKAFSILPNGEGNLYGALPNFLNLNAQNNIGPKAICSSTLKCIAW